MLDKRDWYLRLCCYFNNFKWFLRHLRNFIVFMRLIGNGVCPIPTTLAIKPIVYLGQDNLTYSIILPDHSQIIKKKTKKLKIIYIILYFYHIFEKKLILIIVLKTERWFTNNTVELDIFSLHSLSSYRICWKQKLVCEFNTYIELKLLNIKSVSEIYKQSITLFFLKMLFHFIIIFFIQNFIFHHFEPELQTFILHTNLYLIISYRI